MAPATFAGATTQVCKGRVVWDRDSIISAIQEWVATYGEPPRAADWNPSSAKWSAQLWRVERYRGGRADGSPWPALNTAKRPFGGSLKEAIRAAGFEPAKPGPKRRADVDVEQADRAVISPEGRAILAAARAQAREAERRVAVLEARLERAAERTARIAAERDAARRRRSKPASAAVKTKVVRERVVDEAAVARARRKAAAVAAKSGAVVRESREQVAVARMDAAEARQTAQRLAARLERAEATIATLRGERAELKAQRDRTADRGEARRLSAAELAELRAGGPGGPAVMAEALKELAAARGTSNPVRMRHALRRVAQAAVTWGERI